MMVTMVSFLETMEAKNLPQCVAIIASALHDRSEYIVLVVAGLLSSVVLVSITVFDDEHVSANRPSMPLVRVTIAGPPLFH